VSSREEHLGEHRRGDDPHPDVQADDRSGGAAVGAGLADQPGHRDGLNDRGHRGHQIKRPGLKALAHRVSGELHPTLAERPRSVPEKADDHVRECGDDDGEPVHLFLLSVT
jgi:hypothetical protein